MSSRYAAQTEVPTERSRAEIERLLGKHGATGFLYGWQGQRAVIGFELNGRRYRFTLNLPSPEERRFTHTAHQHEWQQKERSQEAARKAYEQEVRRSWRELALLIKAKLVAVASGIVSVEDEFLSYAITPAGQTVGEWLRPQLEDAERSGRMPPLLPGASE